jgi:ferric-dicitrate binding protein FerR (iron transport regulator)
MWKKYGKYFADWYDERGKRHRRAFDTAGAAKRHSKKMAAEARLRKNAPRPATPPKSRRRGRAQIKTAKPSPARRRSTGKA